MPLIHRLATSSDYDWSLNCHHAAYEEIIRATYGVWDVSAQDGYFKASWDRRKHDVLIWDGQLCGYSAVEVRPDQIYVDQVVVHPSFQGRGIGTAYLREILDLASAKGVPVRLRTCVANRVLTLYTKLGFRVYERTDTHVSLEWAIPA